ncbi:MAG: C-terminal helicase domain-containing protein, partial [Myxococcota bacterium]
MAKLLEVPDEQCPPCALKHRKGQRALAENADLDDADIQRLDYRERSILDVADDAVESQDAVITLNEHFRSTPPIIAFSNARFYSGGLRIMTQRPTVARDSLAVVTVAGRRDPDGINPQEIDRIVAEIRNVVAAQASLPPAGCHSIGVLSPFRNQVERLRDVIGEAIPLDVQRRHGIRVNTAHGFQGEERDVMLLSWVVDESAPSGSFTFLRRPDVVNVAVTRARLRQLSFVSLPTDSPRLTERTRDSRGRARATGG